MWAGTVPLSLYVLPVSTPQLYFFRRTWKEHILRLLHILFLLLLLLLTGTLLFLHQLINQMAGGNRWLRPEVYPLFAAVGVAVVICGMQLVRNVTSNPEVRVKKEARSAGVLENYEEGKRYAEHPLRKFVRNRSPEIMPKINGFFSNPDPK
ncbi:hypothetical protein MLD38_012540 [Melastoma candidum]|uniref:Uncharacterized protein n=1 Tax=Melastoma candidum TaxID=119954 RepID=A0ACB9R6P1_9MYRT|nr:hypothetical protein MLD38_012540 [Melastoma candidum]